MVSRHCNVVLGGSKGSDCLGTLLDTEFVAELDLGDRDIPAFGFAVIIVCQVKVINVAINDAGIHTTYTTKCKSTFMLCNSAALQLHLPMTR